MTFHKGRFATSLFTTLNALAYMTKFNKHCLVLAYDELISKKLIICTNSNVKADSKINMNTVLELIMPDLINRTENEEEKKSRFTQIHPEFIQLKLTPEQFMFIALISQYHNKDRTEGKLSAPISYICTVLSIGKNKMYSDVIHPLIKLGRISVINRSTYDFKSRLKNNKDKNSEETKTTGKILPNDYKLVMFM